MIVAYLLTAQLTATGEWYSSSTLMKLKRIITNNVIYILVMQCFRVGYRGICHASLVFSVNTRTFRRVCMQRKYNWQVAYSTLSQALKNTANHWPGLPLHILRYATGNMQQVGFHSTFPSLLASNSLLRFIWRLLKSELQNLSTPVNHYKHFWRFPKIFRKF